MAESSGERERYALGYGETAHRWMSRRGAASHAGFLIPHLRPGMSLLDCGCGPGTISLGLAEVVAPGVVVGVDIAPLQVERARRLAIEAGVANAAFAAGDAYRLPFADATFDAVFAHAALFHLRDPAAALTEFHRVLRPGGVVGVRDPDYTGWRFELSTPDVETAQRLSLLASRHAGASPDYAGGLGALLGEAGFQRTETREIAVQNPSAAKSAAALADRLSEPAFRETARSEGWIQATKLDRLSDAIRTWAQRPEVAEHVTWFEALGWR